MKGNDEGEVSEKLQKTLNKKSKRNKIIRVEMLEIEEYEDMKVHQRNKKPGQNKKVHLKKPKEITK